MKKTICYGYDKYVGKEFSNNIGHFEMKTDVSDSCGLYEESDALLEILEHIGVNYKNIIDIKTESEQSVAKVLELTESGKIASYLEVRYHIVG